MENGCVGCEQCMPNVMEVRGNEFGNTNFRHYQLIGKEVKSLVVVGPGVGGGASEKRDVIVM